MDQEVAVEEEAAVREGDLEEVAAPTEGASTYPRNRG